MSRRLRICMGKGGREFLRPSYGRSKLNLVSSEEKYLWRCSNKYHSRYFDLRGNSSWEDVRNVHKQIVSGGFCSKIKIVAVVFFATPPYFCWQLVFYWHLLTSVRQNTVKKISTPFSYTYSESWVRKDSVGTCPEKNSRWKFSGTERFTKIFLFSRISISIW